jgi:hypothetical protein
MLAATIPPAYAEAKFVVVSQIAADAEQQSALVIAELDLSGSARWSKVTLRGPS